MVFQLPSQKASKSPIKLIRLKFSTVSPKCCIAAIPFRYKTILHCRSQKGGRTAALNCRVAVMVSYVTTPPGPAVPRYIRADMRLPQLVLRMEVRMSISTPLAFLLIN